MNKENKIEIYLDMDEVVADFKEYAHRVLAGKQLDNGYRFPDQQWARLRDNPRIFRDLKLKDNATKLVDWCTEYCTNNTATLAFLTALPHKNDIDYAIYDKVHWANLYFPNIPVFFGPFSQDKQRYCKGLNSILIDDRRDNCEQWIAAGGRAFQYKNWEECKVWLEQELL